MNLRHRLLIVTDRATSAILVALLAGTTLAFGGRVWWAPPLIGGLALALVLLGLCRVFLDGRMRVLKSPLTGLGILALALAIGQLAPLPVSLSETLSPASRAAYGIGMLPGRAKAIDPSLEIPEMSGNRSPITVDRSATLRWLAGAAACLGVFWVVAHFSDRLGHLYVVWGAVVAAFFLNTAVASVQIFCGTGGLYGFIEPGMGPSWTPSWDDLIAGPATSVLREASAGRGDSGSWAFVAPDRPFFVGSQMGGAGAYLALASIGLPLALALTLQLMAPRGSREGLSSRLAQTGQGSMVVLLYGMVLASSVLVGLLSGPIYSLAFAGALSLVGIPCVRSTGLRWTAVGLTSFALGALAGGVLLGTTWAQSRTAPPPVASEDIEASARIWSDAIQITRDFPVLGSGLGTFATVYPHYKSQDASSTTAMSSLLQWWIETGYVGLALLTIGASWCLVKLPGSLQRVGTADRALAYGLIGAAVGFTLFSAVHWTIELSSIAFAASALGGAGNRWLAGGTDLFVERG